MTMTKLSPAAQAVLDTALKYSTQAWSEATHQRFNLGIAAALRAVAEHCVPDDSEGYWVYIPHVLAVADELDPPRQPDSR